MDLDEEFALFRVELLALAAVHFTAIVSQAFAESAYNCVSVKGGGFLRATPWCDIMRTACVLA